MRKYLILSLVLTGCLNTQTKDNLKRPDFSTAPVDSKSGCCAPVQTKSCCKSKVSFDKESEIPESWLHEDYMSEPF